MRKSMCQLCERAHACPPHGCTCTHVRRMPLILSHIPPLQVRMGWQRVMRPRQTTLQTLPLQTLPLPHPRPALTSVAEAVEAFDCLVLLRHRMSSVAQPRQCLVLLIRAASMQLCQPSTKYSQKSSSSSNSLTRVTRPTGTVSEPPGATVSEPPTEPPNAALKSSTCQKKRAAHATRHTSQQILKF